MTHSIIPTIVIPCFNEEERLADGGYLIELSRYLNANFIYVDDGSSDQTFKILKSVASQTGGQVLRLPINSGKSEAVRIGLLRAIDSLHPSGIVAYLDVDGAFPASVVKEHVLKSTQIFSADNPKRMLYIASRVGLSGRKIARSRFRHYVSRILLSVLGLTGVKLPYDTQSGFKLIKLDGDRLRQALSTSFRTRWLFDIELMCRLQLDWDSEIWEEPVSEWQDVAGSKISLNSSLPIVREFVIIFFLLRRYVRIGNIK